MRSPPRTISRLSAGSCSDFLNSPADYLHRYHCARALLALLRCTTYEPVDLTVARKNPAKALGELEQLLAHTVGPRPAGI